MGENSFYTAEELVGLGLKSYGSNVLISRKASIYGAENIIVGSNVRIDDFCILSGKITLGNNIHIAAYCGLFGGLDGIELKDFVGLSSRCAIYAVSDDYSGNFLAGPTVPDEFRHVISGKVTLEKYVLVGTGTTILTGVTIGEGSSVGSMSLVNKSLMEWGIYAGISCKRLINRDKGLLQKEKEYLGMQQYEENT